jgi:hypothetical protein
VDLLILYIKSVAPDIPSSNSPTVALDEKMAEASDEPPYGKEANPSMRSHSLERIGSQNKSTEANIFSEREGEAEADLEKTGEVTKSTPVAGGVNPADFPDGGLEAW